MSRIAPSCQISNQQLDLLEKSMGAYYASVNDYPAFLTPSDHPLEWRHVLAEVAFRSSRQGPISILEFGSGRSGFPTFLREQLDLLGATGSVSITCQDVTDTNYSYLQQVADQVLISPLIDSVLPEASYDIIFSTHCLEHVTRPEQLLHTLIKLLKPGGSLLLFAPRYDFPFYISPSSGDLNILQRILLSFKLLRIRLNSSFRRCSAFVIDTKPACLDRAFRRDADAIHWVSHHDLRLFASRYGLSLTDLDVSHDASPLSKQWLIDHFCKLAIRLQKSHIPSQSTGSYLH